MKPTALDTLLIAKSLLSKARDLTALGDRHSSTAGIIILQDFVELVVLSLLDELDLDNSKNLDSKSFDELLGELRKAKVPVVKLTTIKALNKQRVICKHYGQLSEPVSVVNYLAVAVQFADAALQHVYGKGLQEIFVTDVLVDGVVKATIDSAIVAAGMKNYLEALCGLRKAFYLAYEYEYCIYDARNYEAYGISNALMEVRGRKAPVWTKNTKWMAENVKTPLDYIQVDYDRLKGDCLEWGVGVVEVENFRRLTPRMIELEKGGWHCDYEIDYAANELNHENFSYCLDALLSFLLGKQQFDAKHKWPKRVKAAAPPQIFIGKPVYKMPIQTSEVLLYVPQDYYYNALRCVTGFNTNESYHYVCLYPQVQRADVFEGYYWGYLLKE